MEGSKIYTSPKCETIEFDAVTTICAGSEGSMGIDPWGDPFDTGLVF